MSTVGEEQKSQASASHTHVRVHTRAHAVAAGGPPVGRIQAAQQPPAAVLHWEPAARGRALAWRRRAYLTQVILRDLKSEKRKRFQ